MKAFRGEFQEFWSFSFQEACLREGLQAGSLSTMWAAVRLRGRKTCLCYLPVLWLWKRMKPTWSSVFLISLLEIVGVGWTDSLTFPPCSFLEAWGAGRGYLHYFLEDRSITFGNSFPSTGKTCEPSVKLGNSGHSHLLPLLSSLASWGLRPGAPTFRLCQYKTPEHTSLFLSDLKSLSQLSRMAMDSKVQVVIPQLSSTQERGTKRCKFVSGRNWIC